MVDYSLLFFIEFWLLRTICKIGFALYIKILFTYKSICSIYEDALNTSVDTERDGPVLRREFDIRENSEFDFSEMEDAKVMRRYSNDTIIDENEPNFHIGINNEEVHEAINHTKWSRLSSVSQSTDATFTTASVGSLEMVLENAEELQMSVLALDNLSKCCDILVWKQSKNRFRVLQKHAL